MQKKFERGERTRGWLAEREREIIKGHGDEMDWKISSGTI